MSNEITDRTNPRSNETTLKVNRSHYYTIRQYVAKMDQFLCALQLDHVLFPATISKEVRSDFDLSMRRTKRSINSLKTKLFRLAELAKPHRRLMTGIRQRKRKKEEKLFPPSSSEIETIDITGEEKSEIIDVIIPDQEVDPSPVREAAMSLLALNGGQEVPEAKTSNLPKDPETPTPKQGLVNQEYYSSGNKIYKLHTTQSINLLKKPINPENKLHITQRINLLRKMISSSNPDQNTVQINKPYLYSYSGPIIAQPQKSTPVTPLIEINGISYSVSEVDFEVLPSKPANSLNNFECHGSQN